MHRYKPARTTSRCLLVSPSHCLLVCLPLILALTAGCGRNESTGGGPTLQDQFREALADPSPAARADWLVRIGYQQYRAGDRAGAKLSYSEADKAAQSIDDPYRRGLSWSLLATAQARSADVAGARNSLKRATAAMADTAPPENRVDLTARVATVYGKELRDATSAGAALAEAERLVPAISSPQDKVTALAAILAAYAAAGKTSDVDRLAALANDIIATISQRRRQVDALAAFGQAFVAAGRKDDGLSRLGEALKLARQIADPYGKAFSLASVGEQYLKAQAVAEARTTLDEAAAAAAAIPQADLRKEAEKRIKDITGSLPAPPRATPR